ncbi:hypothetical protein QBC43DRAFT_290780 [Cladorrhinum sp. PSN259]|nr:hypothetical protein QBC43DRAFT_290780 [Cladorrhinum sp. PSN259]
MKLHIIGVFASLALSPTASPLPTQCTGVLSVVSLFTAEKCSNMEPFWTVSTGLETYMKLKKNDGCQAINATWDIASLRLGLLDKMCSFTAYTDAECKKNGVTLPVEACVTYQEDKWKSFALRGCDRED